MGDIHQNFGQSGPLNALFKLLTQRILQLGIKLEPFNIR
jgi:hypothetical protein